MDAEQTDCTGQGQSPKPIRPVLIISEDTISKYSIFLGHLLAGLASESVSVALICPADCKLRFIVPPSVEIIRHPAYTPILFRQNRIALIDRLERFKPTVLHCLSQKKASFTRSLSRKLALPYVVSVNSLQKHRWQLFVSKTRCKKIIVPAETIAENVTKIHPRLSDRVDMVNIGTFTARSVNCFSKPGQLAGILVAHRFKDPNEMRKLLLAIKHLALDSYEFMLVLAGCAKGDDQLQQQLDNLGISRMVISFDTLQPARSILAAGDIFVQPIAGDSFNPLLLEAMGVGAAVAACKGGVDDLIIDEQTAVVFDPADELSIYSTLRRLLGGQDFAKKLAHQAQQHLRENHSVSEMIEAYLKIYQQE